MFYYVGVWDAAGFFRVLIGTKSSFCFRSILHVILNVMPHTAHRRSLLSAARSSSSSSRHLARSSTVHVEYFDTMHSRKVQRQAPPDSPETGNTYFVYIYITVGKKEDALLAQK